MKSLKTTLKVYLSLSILSLITYACCEEQNFRISGTAFHKTYDANTAQIFEMGTTALITGPFNVNIYQQADGVLALHNLSFGTTAYATSCPENYLNYMQEESLELSFHKSIVYNGDTLAPGSNLRNLEGLKFEIFWSDLSIYFTDSLMQQLSFDDGPYQLTISIKTDDGLDLRSQINMEFEVN
jgi:hypothetical protein